jgi:hypothetical protein
MQDEPVRLGERQCVLRASRSFYFFPVIWSLRVASIHLSPICFFTPLLHGELLWPPSLVSIVIFFTVANADHLYLLIGMTTHVLVLTIQPQDILACSPRCANSSHLPESRCARGPPFYSGTGHVASYNYLSLLLYFHVSHPVLFSRHFSAASHRSYPRSHVSCVRIVLLVYSGTLINFSSAICESTQDAVCGGVSACGVSCATPLRAQEAVQDDSVRLGDRA